MPPQAASVVFRAGGRAAASVYRLINEEIQRRPVSRCVERRALRAGVLGGMHEPAPQLRLHRRLAQATLLPSRGSVGDALDTPTRESMIGLLKIELALTTNANWRAGLQLAPPGTAN